jgi:3-oxoadipate:acetyl-CoA acetyltransferase
VRRDQAASLFLERLRLSARFRSHRVAPGLIINVALTGMIPTKAENPNLPVSPQEIVEDARRCRDAGASMVHVHARDEGGRPTHRADVYREIVTGVREACPDLIVVVSTSGRVEPDFEPRSEVLALEGAAKPDMASLTLGSLNFPRQASISEPETIRRLAEAMRERGIVPELEVFDFGMVDYAKYLIERGTLEEPFYFNLILGSLGTLRATPLHLAALAEALPGGSIWAGAGIGRFQLEVNSMAIAMGGHVRVGLEDNLFFDSEKTRPASNESLVRRLVEIAGACEREIASPQEAREQIGLLVAAPQGG